MSSALRHGSHVGASGTRQRSPTTSSPGRYPGQLTRSCITYRTIDKTITNQAAKSTGAMPHQRPEARVPPLYETANASHGVLFFGPHASARRSACSAAFLKETLDKPSVIWPLIRARAHAATIFGQVARVPKRRLNDVLPPRAAPPRLHRWRVQTEAGQWRGKPTIRGKIQAMSAPAQRPRRAYAVEKRHRGFPPASARPTPRSGSAAGRLRTQPAAHRGRPAAPSPVHRSPRPATNGPAAKLKKKPPKTTSSRGLDNGS
jgi:hypothetical protein